MPLTIELIPDPEFGGFTARVPDVPAYGELRQVDWNLPEFVRG